MKRFGVLVLCTVAAATLTASRSQAALTPSLETSISTILSSSGIDPSTLVTGITGTATSVSVTSTAGSLTILNPTTPGATVKPGDVVVSAINNPVIIRTEPYRRPVAPSSSPIPEARTALLYALGFLAIGWTVLRSSKPRLPARA